MATFTRASKATYINKQGVLVEAGIDEPRFEKEGILIEGASTNLCPQSHISMDTGWLYSYGGNTLKPSEKDSGFTCSMWSTKHDTTAHNYNLIQYKLDDILKVGSKYTLSVFYKRVAGPLVGAIKAGLFSSNGAVELISKSEQYIGAGWYRAMCLLEVHKIPENLYARVYAIYLDGPAQTLVSSYQIEELPFASSYIPTNGTPVTRAGDRMYVDGGVLPAGNPNITISYSASVLGYVAGDDALSEQFIFTSSGGDTGYIRHAFRWRQDNLHRMFYGGGVYTSVSFNTTPAEALLPAQYTYLSKEGGYLGGFINGALKEASIEESEVKGTTSRLHIGSGGSRLNYLFGHIKNFRIWNHALTAEQIATL